MTFRSARALVVGAGRMGTFHVRALIDLGLRVRTVDPDPSRRAHYMSVPGGAWDVVVIATPIHTLAREALRWAGHEGWLLVEKPAAETPEDCQRLVDLLDGQRVAVGYVERFNPQVRMLEHALAVSAPAVSARFTRWNDRPSPDVEMDLRSHDVDLAAHLGLDCPVVFDARDRQRLKRREVTVELSDGSCLCTDLMAHTESPLHAQWRTFLAGAEGCATLTDAALTLEALAPRSVAA